MQILRMTDNRVVKLMLSYLSFLWICGLLGWQ